MIDHVHRIDVDPDTHNQAVPIWMLNQRIDEINQAIDQINWHLDYTPNTATQETKQ